MIHLFNRITVVLLLFTASVPTRAQETAYSFDGCRYNHGFVNTQDSSRSIPPVYCSASGFSEGLAAVKKGEKWGYIDVNNKTVIDFQFDYARSFKEGRAIVQKGTFYGVIDKAGKFVIPPRYFDLISFDVENRPYYLSRDSTFFQGIIDVTGKEILPHRYTFVIPYESNLSNQRFYKNIPFYTVFQVIDTTEGSFYEQFNEGAHRFSPEKGRHDIYDLAFNKLASRNSTNYMDGFRPDQLRRIDNFLGGSTDLTLAEKVKKIEALLNSPEPDSLDSTTLDTTYRAYREMNHDEIKDHLEGLGYVLFTNGEGKTGLKKGRNVVIPAENTFLKLLNGVISAPLEEDIAYLKENYAGAYRSRENSVFDLFCIAAGDDGTKGHLYTLSGKQILSLEKMSIVLTGTASVGFEYVDLKKEKPNRHGLVNWAGETVLPPVYKDIDVLRKGQLLVKQENKVEKGAIELVSLYTNKGEVVIPPGVYSEIKPFKNADGLYLVTRSDPYATVEGKKASRYDNRDHFILKVEGNASRLTGRFKANQVSAWALDVETGMLPYRQNKVGDEQ